MLQSDEERKYHGTTGPTLASLAAKDKQEGRRCWAETGAYFVILFQFLLADSRTQLPDSIGQNQQRISQLPNIDPWSGKPPGRYCRS